MSHSHSQERHTTIDTIDELKSEVQVLRALEIQLEAQCRELPTNEKAVIITVLHMIGNLRRVYED